MEKFGRITTFLMVAWFVVVAGLGLVISFGNGTFF